MGKVLLNFAEKIDSMVRHVILWKLKDELSADEKLAIKTEAKAGLEGLLDKIPGVKSIKVHIDGLASSNVDMMLDSSFETAEALANYARNPLHVEVADTKVRPFTSNRSCLDFED